MKSAKVLMSGLSSRAMMAALMAGLASTGLAVGAQRDLGVVTERTSRRTGSKPKQLPRKESQLRLQAAQAKRDRRALRNLRIKANGGYGR
jgi:hypothetical protein